jgi:hypothetical protein
MASGGGRGAILGAAVASLLAGGAAGWLAGRASVPPPPPPPFYANPLGEVARDEVLVLKGDDGIRDTYRVVEVTGETVLLAVGKEAPGQAATTRQLRVARSFWGALVILGGDIDPASAEASVRDFVVKSATPEDVRVESLGRTFHCWRIEGMRKGSGPTTYWITDELPVHGIVKMSSGKGVSSVVEGFEFGKGR